MGSDLGQTLYAIGLVLVGAFANYSFTVLRDARTKRREAVQAETENRVNFRDRLKSNTDMLNELKIRLDRLESDMSRSQTLYVTEDDMRDLEHSLRDVREKVAGLEAVLRARMSGQLEFPTRRDNVG